MGLLDKANARSAKLLGKKFEARYEAAKADPRPIMEKVADGYRENGGDRAREGEVWKLGDESVVIRKTAAWTTAAMGQRTTVKVTAVTSGRKLDVLASQLRRVQ